MALLESTISPSSSCSSSNAARFAAAEHAEQSDHYETPWEFKNRALSAALGRQRQQQQKQLKNGKLADREKQQKVEKVEDAVRKRLSLPPAAIGQQKGISQRQRQVQLPSPNDHRAHQQQGMSNSLSESNGMVGGQQQQKLDGKKPPMKADLPKANAKTGNESPPSLPPHQKGFSAQIAQPMNSLSANNSSTSSSDSANSKRQKAKECKEAMAARLPTTENSHQKQRHRQPVGNGQQQRCYPLVSINPNSPSTKEVIAFCQQNRRHSPADGEAGIEGEDLARFVHERMERAEAELLLGALPLGTHLLRRRPDHSLALSLRASQGVLHIKLELRQHQWVLGEGPHFPTVHSMLRAYRRTELPVRGAEQIRLGPLLRPEDVPGRGLLLL